MNRSESIASLAAALAKAQAEIRPAVKDSENPHFRSRYADLASVWDACRTALTGNGLSVVQLPEVTSQGVIAVETILLHDSGEFIGGRIEIPLAKQDAQGVGSAITYARRYSLAAVVGIAPDDDDGEAAVGRFTSPPAKAKAAGKQNRQPNAQNKSSSDEHPTTKAKVLPEETGDAKTAEYHQRIRGALRRLFAEDKAAALAHVENLSTWVDKDTGEVKAAGVKDYRKLSGKRLEILCHKLEDEVKKLSEPEPSGVPCPICDAAPDSCQCDPF